MQLDASEINWISHFLVPSSEIILLQVTLSRMQCPCFHVLEKYPKPLHQFISESDFDYCKLHEGVISAAIQGVVSLLKIINIASSFCWEPLVWQVLSLWTSLQGLQKQVAFTWCGQQYTSPSYLCSIDSPCSLVLCSAISWSYWYPSAHRTGPVPWPDEQQMTSMLDASVRRLQSRRWEINPILATK